MTRLKVGGGESTWP